jgi:hypothetical protein
VYMQVSREDIHNAVLEYLDLIEIGKSNAEENLQTLEMVLDKLALAYYYADSQLDEADYADAPKNEKKWRILAGKRFPDFGYYKVPCYVIEQLAESELMIGDAIDDLADIAADLQDVAWHWKHTSINNALWHFRFGFKAHWDDHLRYLQFFIRAFKESL